MGWDRVGSAQLGSTPTAGVKFDDTVDSCLAQAKQASVYLGVVIVIVLKTTQLVYAK